MRLLSSICLLAYCLLVKNVCCLELNQDALHIWFVLLCSVFKGLLHRKCLSDLFRLPQQLLYHIKVTSDCQLFLKVFSISFFEIFQQLIYRNLSFVICQEFFLKFFSIESSFVSCSFLTTQLSYHVIINMSITIFQVFLMLLYLRIT